VRDALGFKELFRCFARESVEYAYVAQGASVFVRIDIHPKLVGLRAMSRCRSLSCTRASHFEE